MKSIVSVFALAIVLGACHRGPAPPSPTEDLVPSAIGIVAVVATSPPFVFDDGRTFGPATGAHVRHVKNWPADPAIEEDVLRPGILLLGGQKADGTWWYRAAAPTSRDCWAVYGGSFDQGTTIQFSSGLIVPKAPGFEIRPTDPSVDVFPGHGGDLVCLDEHGQALFIQLFQGA